MELTQQQIRLQKLEQLKQLGIDPFGSRFKRTHSFTQVKLAAENKSHDELNTNPISVATAGRVITVRDMGKVAFLTLQDKETTIQVYIRKDTVSELEWKIFELTDLGDFIGIRGDIMLTRTNEITIKAIEYIYLTKCLNPLPEKYHGLVNVEDRYRKRYLDLIANPEVKDVFIKRSKIIRTIQNYLDSIGYMEVETPILQPRLGGASAKPFVTHFNSLDSDFYLRIATELPLKKLIVGGLEKVYEIGRLFRNEGMSIRHNPEFTTIELYSAYDDLDVMMELVQTIICKSCLAVNNTLEINYGGVDFNLAKPFKKVRMVDLVKKETKVDFSVDLDQKQLDLLIKKYHLKVESYYKQGHIMNLLFEQLCEEKLIEPTFVIGHPIEITPLAAKDPTNPRFTRRFELFINAREYANAYGELNDPIDQRQRLENQLEQRNSGDEEANELDEEFIEALEYGLPPTGGLGLGIDRLVMFLTNSNSISDVLFFPQLKRLV